MSQQGGKPQKGQAAPKPGGREQAVLPGRVAGAVGIGVGLGPGGYQGPIFLEFVINILRPDDLVALTILPQNLQLDTSDPKKPMLVVKDSSAPAYLVVQFPPQSITEKAYFEVGNVTSEPSFNQVPAGTPPLPAGDDPLDPSPGSLTTPARIAGPSRLVFQLPKKLTKIPYQSEALLDWSQLDPVVSPTAQGKVLPPPIPQPGPLETALEIPYRLILSPGTGVSWVNAHSPVTHAGRTELWHTRLAKIVKASGAGGVKTTFVEASLEKPIPLRAIWSPDFVDHGALPSHALDDMPFLAPLSPRDRAQIVILTSGTVGYYVPLTGGQAAPWKPTPIQASGLFLSALGGWLSSRGTWSPLPTYNIPPSPLKIMAVGLQPQPLDLSEWCHLATQGRDHYVKVVYAGFLYPFGHCASLVKVTERKFVNADEVPAAQGFQSSVTAYLRQHMYIVVREREKSYKGAPYTYGGREMPFLRSVRINTVVTPDIDKPPPTDSFWIEVGGSNFQFHLTAVDLAGASINILAPLMFVSDSETNIPGVQTTYRTSAASACTVQGKKVAYADPSAGDTILKTTVLNFDTEFLFPPPYPSVPFIPILSSATVNVPSLEHLLGITTGVTIQFYQPYLENGLDSNAGVFATVGQDNQSDQPAVSFTAKTAGGFATPCLTMTALSARKGLVSGSPDDAAAGLIDPAQFFGNINVTAMLFGTIPLTNLIPLNAIAKAPAVPNAPEIRTQSLPNARHPTQIVTKLKWEPQLTNYSSGPVQINFNNDGLQSKLSLNATITQALDGSPSQSSVKGVLSNFEVSLFGVVGITMDSITFTSSNGSKTNVTVTLAGSNALGFMGALHFIQTLADIIPPGLFGGDGPSIDLTSTGIKVSYTLGLPSISIGVFSLENIAITAGLDLPYINGKPAFEFAFCSRSSPFLLTVECLGGGGFVHLIVNADGVQMVEGSLEFGGEFSIDLGVASGGVHIMAGIYFQLAGSNATLTGFVDIGGEVSVMGIVSISIDLNLSLSFIHTAGGDKIQGRATLTISVSILFFSISVQVSVERSFGSGAGDPRMEDVITAGDWETYALAFAG